MRRLSVDALLSNLCVILLRFARVPSPSDPVRSLFSLLTFFICICILGLVMHLGPCFLAFLLVCSCCFIMLLCAHSLWREKPQSRWRYHKTRVPGAFEEGLSLDVKGAKRRRTSPTHRRLVASKPGLV